ncbi:MAG: cytochrome c maturation protein CcmE [Chloroflexi bacterium]|nr:cytochrome c maturation protein CcmE [Chloroflexota bacterium]
MSKETLSEKTRRRKRWLPVIVIVLLLGVGYGAYSLFIHSGTDFMPLSQFAPRAESMRGQIVSIGGKVAPGSINWDSQAQVMKFALTDGREQLAITYQGLVPDNFKPGMDLVVKGRYGQDDVFTATDFGNKRSVCNVCH